MATAQKTKPEKVRFVADGTGLRVTIDHLKEVYVDGRKIVNPEFPGLVVEFLPDGVGGQFFETDDPHIIATMRARIDPSSPTLDPKYAEVPILKPPSADVLKQIVGLAARGDTKALVELARAEDESHQREDVLEAIADALEQITA